MDIIKTKTDQRVGKLIGGNYTVKIRMKHRLTLLTLMLFLGVCYCSPYAWAADDDEIIKEPKSLQHEYAPAPNLGEMKTLTLEEALTAGYKYNPNLKEAELSLDRAEIVKEQATSPYFAADGMALVGPSEHAVMSNYIQADVAYDTAKKTLDSQKAGLEKQIITAYLSAVKSHNQIMELQNSLGNLQQQDRLYQIALVNGLISNYDMRSSKRTLEQLKQSLSMAETSYNQAVGTLRTLLNQGNNWNPTLTSRPLATSFDRADLSLETSRALQESITMLQAQSSYDLKKGITYYYDTTAIGDFYKNKIDLTLSELAVEQASRDTRSSVESAYYNIDSLEDSIASAQKGLEQKRDQLAVAKLNYELGLIPLQSYKSTETSLKSAELALEQAELEYENLLCDLSTIKASYNYLTGKTVYYRSEWSTGLK